METLRHDHPDWQLKNACPACTYLLNGEPSLKFKMLFVMDGNDSLKRVSRETLGNDPDNFFSPSSELPGQELPCHHRYLTRDFVNSFSTNHSEPSLNSAEVNYLTYCHRLTSSPSALSGVLKRGRDGSRGGHGSS